MRRREFFASSAMAGAVVTILPEGLMGEENSPNEKLNVALIGVDGRGRAFHDVLKQENVVALCDIREDHLAAAAKVFPRAKRYVDWRKCLEQKDVEAVVCATTDFTHAFIAQWAMNRGMHVYLEKPMAISVEEARLLRATYIENRNKLATQVGTQEHARPNFNRVSELIRDGAIGELSDVLAWGDRQLRRDGYLPAKGTPPSHLHYDLWLGPVPNNRPYNPGYFDGKHGANCLNWNMYWDFSSGQVGDMGAHTMDLAWNAIDAEYPNEIEAHGEPFNPEVTPVELQATFHHPANDWRGPIRVSWFQGGRMPSSPHRAIDLSGIGHGVMFRGTRGFLIADFRSRMLIPFGAAADMTYYQPRSAEDILPPVGHFQREWINACKGDLQTSCYFDYNGLMCEQMLLGLVAYRAGEKIVYDGKIGMVTNHSEANDLLKIKYRPGWVLNG